MKKGRTLKMRRLLICLFLVLPVCLFLQDYQFGLEERANGTDFTANRLPLERESKNLVIAFSPINPALSFPGNIAWATWVETLSKDRLYGVALLRQEFLGTFAVTPHAGLPGLPWACLQKTGSDGLQYVIENQPIAFLQLALDRYDAEVQSYSCILRKRERIGGRLHATERVQCHFLEKPFSVYMKWIEGARMCGACTWVEGQNNGKMWVRPAGLTGKIVGVLSLSMDDKNSTATTRYTIDEFGIRWGTLRAQRSLHEALNGSLQEMRYLGEEDVPETGGKRCHKFHFKYDPPDEFGLADLTLYFDVVNWLQIGSVLKQDDGSLLAEYFFRDIVLNPKLSPKQFEKSAI